MGNLDKVIIDLLHPIGPQFRKIRESQNVTLRHMAYLIDVIETSLQHWESVTGPFAIGKAKKSFPGLSDYAIKYAKALSIKEIWFKPYIVDTP